MTQASQNRIKILPAATRAASSAEETGKSLGPADLEKFPRYQGDREEGCARKCNIVFPQSVYKKVVEHLKADTSREHGGYLLGYETWDDESKTPTVVVEDAVPGKHTRGTSVSLTFTLDTQRDLDLMLDKCREEGREPPQKIGWYHSHPNISIFLSHWDLNVCKDFDSRRTPIALVVDPIQDRGGFFVGSKEGYKAQCPQGFHEKCDLQAESLVNWSNMRRVDSGAAAGPGKRVQIASPATSTALRITPPRPPRPTLRVPVALFYVFVVAALAFVGFSQWLILGRLRPAPPAASGAMSVAPSYFRLSAAQPQEFKASIPGSDNQEVDWSVTPPGMGTITRKGVYTAPQSVAIGDTATIIATSKSDPTKSARFEVMLMPSVASLPASVDHNPALTTPVAVSAQPATKKADSAPSTAAKAAPVKNVAKATDKSKPTQQTAPPTKKQSAQADLNAGKSAPSSATAANPAAAGGNQPAAASSGASQTATSSSTGAAAKDAGGNGPAAPAASTSVPSTPGPGTPGQITQPNNAPPPGNSPPTDTGAAKGTAVPVSIEPSGPLTANDIPRQFRVNGVSGEVSWSMDPQFGVLSPSGLYTPPPLIAKDTTVTIKALSKDSSKSAEATVKLLKSEKSPN